jgi:acyl dehydratase
MSTSAPVSVQKNNDGTITDEALTKLRARIGEQVVPRQRPWNTTVNVDSIFHFVQGIGDGNPLYRDPEYARGTSYGAIVAPPTYLLSGFGREQHGLPGVHGFWAGDDWHWKRILRVGDELHGHVELIGVDDKQSEFAGRLIIQTSRITFVNQRDEELATCDRWIIRTERSKGANGNKYAGIEKRRWTDEEIEDIARQYAAENVRGATPRYWEDVAEGDLVGPILKGPLTVTEEAAFFAGAGSNFIQASGVAWDYFRKHPRAAVRDGETNALDFPIRVHWDDAWAQRVGVPAAYDDAGQRIAWMGQLVTDWMGDAGFLKRLRVELRRFVIMGDLLRLEGKVVRKYRDGGEALVDLELQGANQRGEIVCPGTATVVLPLRQAGS